MTRSFEVTWDYRCPFARNAHEHVVAGLRAGEDWDVHFVPFSLEQVHVAEGDPDIWGRAELPSGVPAMLAGIVVRDRVPERFLEVHTALFRARHDEGIDLRDATNVDAVLADAGVDAASVRAEIDAGWPLEVFRKEHEAAAGDHTVWGVPTFVRGSESVFVRLMTRPEGDSSLAARTVNRLLDLMEGFPELNEYKHTTIRR
ncbi:MAG TPA: DsbA family protein [Acidimicrobiales bacterium]